MLLYIVLVCILFCHITFSNILFTSYFILFVFVSDDGGRPKHVVQDDKTNKLIKVYLIDL
jgi:hypothetical protein